MLLFTSFEVERFNDSVDTHIINIHILLTLTLTCTLFLPSKYKIIINFMQNIVSSIRTIDLWYIYLGCGYSYGNFDPNYP